MSRTILEASTADLIYSLGVHAARIELYAHGICDKPSQDERDQAAEAVDELNRRLPGPRRLAPPGPHERFVAAMLNRSPREPQEDR